MRWIVDPKTGDFVEPAEYYARKYANTATSDMPCPQIMSDQCELKSMVDGQIYTSKRALLRSYREKGYIEIGNEEQKPRKRTPPDRKAIEAAVGSAMSKVGLGA